VCDDAISGVKEVILMGDVMVFSRFHLRTRE
jgi:hypothetical protein